jgi:hypothetical protein
MSLDVSLQEKKSRKEHCYHCGSEYKVNQTLYDANITHNLTDMAAEAGIYEALWRPEERGWKYAKDIIGVLEKGLADLKERPSHYVKFNASNGWGMYEHFVPFVENYLRACKSYPSAIIKVSR